MFEDDDDEEEEEEQKMDFEEAVRRLQEPDAIMEKDIDDAIDVYLESNSTSVDEVVEMFMKSFQGNAVICNQLSEFLTQLGDKEPTTETPARKLGRRAKKVKEVKKDEPSASTEGTSSEATTSSNRNEPFDGAAASAEAIEEALTALVIRHFDPDTGDQIFEDGGIGIEWLPDLISHRSWRKCLYRLMEQFPQCMMLNFTVKLISDAGFQNEITNVITAVQQLDIFSRVFLTAMENLLKQMNQGGRTEEYEKAFNDLFRVVCQNEHTYVYAQVLLKAARKQGGRAAAACADVAESLRAALTGKEHESTALRIANSLCPSDQLAGTVSQALMTIVGKGELNPADINIIYEQYILPRPPPLDVIRDPMFVELLIDALFHHEGAKVLLEHRDKYVFLLAYTASVAETIKNNGIRTQNRIELDPVRDALYRAVSLLDEVDDLLTELDELRRVSRVPIVAAGIIYYVRTMLLSDARIGDLSPPALVLLDHIATQQEHLRQRVFDVCGELYDKVSTDAEAAEVIMERQRVVIDRLVHLLSVGFAIPVLQKITAMFQDDVIDASLVRYFAMEVLEIVGAPYSQEFTALLLPMVSNDEIFDKAVLDRYPPAAEFIQHCSGAK